MTKEHGIIMGDWSVQRIQAGQKFVTRRLEASWLKVKAGDVLRVKETWGIAGARIVDPCVNYQADGAQIPLNRADGGLVWFSHDQRITVTQPTLLAVPEGWRNCMFMPKWVSRIYLKAQEDARRERLQDITEADAIAEGIADWRSGAYRRAFATLWDSLHGGKGVRWADNPTVTRIGKFERIT